MRADEDPRRLEAEAIYSEGLRLHDQHKELEALERFNKAFSVYPSPNILFNIARQEQLLQRSLAALRHYREAMKNGLLRQANVTLGKQYITELEAKLGRVEVVGPAGLEVSIGSTLLLPLKESVDVEPGQVSAVGQLRGVRYEGRVVAVAGRVVRLELTAVGGAASSSQPDSANPWGAGEYTALGLWVGTAAMVGVGFGFVLGANRAADKIDAARAASASPNTSCTGINSDACVTRRADESDRVFDTNAAVVSFVGAVALGIAGTTLFVVSRPRKPRTYGAQSLVPLWGGKDGTGLIWRGEF